MKEISKARPSGIRRPSVHFALLAVVGSLFLGGTSAHAAAPEFLFQIPPDSIAPGSGAGQLDNPRGMAADAVTGHLFVANRIAARVEEFTSWGSFVKGWGWNVAPDGAPGDSVSDQFETCTTSCQAGVKGAGVGQFSNLLGVAVDGTGDVYAYESPLEGTVGFRVQKFDSAGNFLLMFGAGVNQGPVHPGNSCTAQHLTEGDTCGSGLLGAGDGEFSNRSVGNYITYNPQTNTIFVGDVDRIQEFTLDGAFKGKIELGGTFEGQSVNALATDPNSGDLYVSFGSSANVYRLDSASVSLEGSSDPDVVDVLSVGAPRALAVDAAGRVYVVDSFEFSGEVLGFDAAGNPTAEMEDEDGFASSPVQESGATPALNGLATNVIGPGSKEPGDLYVDYFRTGLAAYVNVYGSAPEFEDPEEVPPTIAEQYAVSVDTETAVLKASINPHFWTDTTYFVQYGTAACPEAGWEGPACLEQPLSPALLSPKPSNAPLVSAGVPLSDLAPNTTYHYRFVASSGGGGPVFGVGGEPGLAGEGGSFRTFPLQPSVTPDPACPNEHLRTGPSARLPDCRAYELVSPLAKNNADVLAVSPLDYPVTHDRSARSGQRFTYSAGAAFAGPDASPSVSQFLAERHPGEGWHSQSLSPPRTRLLVTSLLPALDNEFMIFSEDLCDAWLKMVYGPPLAEDAPPEYPNLYRRRNCGATAGSYETLTTAPPPHLPAGAYSAIQPLGASADGARSIFLAPDNLPGTAAPTNETERLQLYEHSAEDGLGFLCILPNGSATNQACYAGTAEEVSGGISRQGSFDNAISASGDRVFWTEGSGSGGGVSGPGVIYVKFAAEPKSRQVSQKVSGGPARFWGAADDGSRAIFGFESGPQSGRLYSFDVDAEQPALIAAGVVGVMGMSEDAGRVYFASSGAIAGSGQNSEEDEAQEGKRNLYLWEEGGGTTFIAKLAAGENPSPIASSPWERTSRVSPDGESAVFTATASLTGYDNLDAISGEPDAEVFLYDAPEAKLRCVSCNPSGARPHGRKLPRQAQSFTNIWYAAKIPQRLWPHHGSRVLAEDGSRVFFESTEALVLRDTNSRIDVYQWEEAGTGSCAPGDATFVADSEGCIELISSGEDGRDAVFLDASANGEDVFFSTLSSLLPQDYGLIDIYDARVGGGFSPAAEHAECEGEACQSPPPPPADPTPASAAFRGAGNVAEQPPGCRPAARRARSLSRRAKRLRRAARRSRSAARSRALRGKARRTARRARRVAVRAKRCRRAGSERGARK